MSSLEPRVRTSTFIADYPSVSNGITSYNFPFVFSFLFFSSSTSFFVGCSGQWFEQLFNTQPSLKITVDWEFENKIVWNRNDIGVNNYLNTSYSDMSITIYLFHPIRCSKVCRHSPLECLKRPDCPLWATNFKNGCDWNGYPKVRLSPSLKIQDRSLIT